MPNPLRDFFLGTFNPPKRELVEALTPRRTFDDVILPLATRRALEHALAQIKKRDLIFGRWGFAERHATGLGLAFNFAGPPGTGKTICAEAIAHALGKKLLMVRYSEMESLWAGETGKNVAAVFHSAREQDAVLFFDEADAIAGRRFSNVTQGYQREANTVVNVLLKELEEFDGVVIFATNLAANFDPAFERRVRTHILFEMPGPEERARIWQVQLSRRTPLADDVDFAELGRKYAVAGGDIKNAVLKAAQFATAEPGADAEKKIHQRHFEAGMRDVLAAKKVMEQTLFTDGDGSNAGTLAGFSNAWSQFTQQQQDLTVQVNELTERLGQTERQMRALPGIVERFDEAARTAQAALQQEITAQLETLQERTTQTDSILAQQKEEIHAVLTTLHDDMATTTQRLDVTTQRLDATTQRLDAFDTTLAKREADAQALLETRLRELGSQLEEGLKVQHQHVNQAIEQAQQKLAEAQHRQQTIAYGLGGSAIVIAVVALVMALR